jgi:hypothetical protein
VPSEHGPTHRTRPTRRETDLAAAYAAMAADRERERGAEAWADALIGDMATEPLGDRSSPHTEAVRLRQRFVDPHERNK